MHTWQGYIEGKTASRGIPCRVYATAGKETQGAFALEVCEKVLAAVQSMQLDSAAVLPLMLAEGPGAAPAHLKCTVSCCFV